MDHDLARHIMQAFTVDSPEYALDLPDGDPLKDPAMRIGDLVTSGVEYLWKMFPNHRINRLMSVVWHLIGNRVTPVAIGPDVPSVSFTVVQQQEVLKAIIFMPRQWTSMVELSPSNELGALVYVGSQAVDFYTGRIQNGETSERMTARARAYEAEFLRLVPAGELSTYQRTVLAEFPDGLDSPAAAGLLYDPKPDTTPS